MAKKSDADQGEARKRPQTRGLLRQQECDKAEARRKFLLVSIAVAELAAESGAGDVAKDIPGFPETRDCDMVRPLKPAFFRHFADNEIFWKCRILSFLACVFQNPRAFGKNY